MRPRYGPADLPHLPRPLRGRGRERRVVAAAHGLDASGYTFAYVAGWAGPDLTCVRQAAETVTKAARTILGRCNANTATGSDDLADTA